LPGIRALVNPALAATRGRSPAKVLHRVGHVGVFRGYLRLAQRTLEYPAGRADERLALLVLDVTRLLADQHDLGVRVASAEDHLGGPLVQIATLALGRGCGHVRQARRA
jgi:hypothetical protein